MDWKKIAVGGGLLAAAPFTGGATLPWLPAALGATGVATGVSGAFSSKAGADPKKKAAADSAALAPFLTDLKASSVRNRGTAADLSGMGQESLQPVVDYFKQLLGGDDEALLKATQPERARVIDQYDTARKAISEFSPRGGGTNRVMGESRFDQADTLSNITAMARRDAAGKAGTLGVQMQGLGLSAQQLASADIGTIIQAILGQSSLDITKSGQNKQLAGGLAEGLGTLLGLYLTRGNGTTPTPAVAG